MILGQRQILNSLNTRRSDTDLGQNVFICCSALYTGYFHSLRFRSPCLRETKYFASLPLPLFRSNRREIDLTTGNRIYKSFPQRVILL